MVKRLRDMAAQILTAKSEGKAFFNAVADALEQFGSKTGLIEEIQAEQDHGRSKYGFGPNDFAHDDSQPDNVWHRCIADHNERAKQGTPMERRQHLVKVAGLAISAIESFDRKRKQ